MQNSLLVDIGKGLAKKPFERMFWCWGPRWSDFIRVDPPLTEDTPLWQRDQNSLNSVRLFDLSPDELQDRITFYWQQAFWKRCLLGLFTSIHSKIKLWSYYHRCLSFREVCIKNQFNAREPIDFVFEQYLGREIIQQLNRSRIQFENYLDKRAGSLRIKNNLNFLQSIFIIDNGRFFSKLMKKKLAQLSTESDKNSLQSQLKKEYNRLKMILYCYLSTWCENIFNLLTPDDETIHSGTFVDASTGKEISYSVHSIKDWVKIKQRVIASMLEEKSPEQLIQIKNLLESCLTTLRLLIDTYSKNYVKLIVGVRKRRLSGDKAIQQAEILQTELIHFFKKSVFLFHPDKSFGNEELRKIQTELFKQFQQLSEKSQEKIKQNLQTLRDYLPKRRNIQEFLKMERNLDLSVAKLEQSMSVLDTNINHMQTKISKVEKKIIGSPAFLKVIHKQSSNRLIQQENETEWISRPIPN